MMELESFCLASTMLGWERRCENGDHRTSRSVGRDLGRSCIPLAWDLHSSYRYRWSAWPLEPRPRNMVIPAEIAVMPLKHRNYHNTLGICMKTYLLLETVWCEKEVAASRGSFHYTSMKHILKLISRLELFSSSLFSFSSVYRHYIQHLQTCQCHSSKIMLH